MKAITLWQPWASLIFMQLDSEKAKRGAKRVETRSWNTNFRGRIAIHAAKFRKLDQAIYNDIRCAIRAALGMDLMKDQAATKLYYFENGIPANHFGSVIGTVNVKDCVPIEQLYGTEYDTPLERACGDWSPGRYGWILTEPEEFKTPVPAKGSQGFWNWIKEDYQDEEE